MTLKKRLLAAVSSCIQAIEEDLLPRFNEEFEILLKDVEDASRAGALSLEEARLVAQVANSVEMIASGMDQLDKDFESRSAALQTQISVELDAADDCSASCSQPHSHSTVPFARSPTPPSPPTALIPLARSRSHDSGSDNDSDSEDSPKNNNNNNNNKKGGPENLKNFRHLRDWFLLHLAHPFPSSTQKKELAVAKDLPMNSINLWFTNMRRRSGWTAAQQKFASSDPKLMVALVNNFLDPKKQKTLPADVVEELNRIQGYIDERGQERVRDYMVTVIEEGLEAGKNVPDDEWDEDEDGEEGEDDDEEEPEEIKVYEGGGGWEGGGLKRKASGGLNEEEEEEIDEALGLGGRGSKRGRVEGRSFPSSSHQSAADTIRKSSNNSTATSGSFAYSDDAPTPLSSFDDHSPEQHVSPDDDSPYLYPVATQQPQSLSHSSRPVAPMRRTTSVSRNSISKVAEHAWSTTSSPQLQHQQQQHNRSSSASSSLRIVSGGSGSSNLAPLLDTPEELEFGHQVSPTRRRRDDDEPFYPPASSYDRYPPQPPPQQRPYYSSSHPRHSSSSYPYEDFPQQPYPPDSNSQLPHLQAPHDPQSYYPSSSASSSSRYQQPYAPETSYYDERDSRDPYFHPSYPPQYQADASSYSSLPLPPPPPPLPSSDRNRQQQTLYNHNPLASRPFNDSIQPISRPKKKRAVTQPHPFQPSSSSNQQRSLSYGSSSNPHSVLSPPMGLTDQNATYIDQGATGGRNSGPPSQQQQQHFQQQQQQPMAHSSYPSLITTHVRKDSSGSLGSSLSALLSQNGEGGAGSPEEAKKKREVFLAKKERLRLEREELEREGRELGFDAEGEGVL